MGVNLVLEQAKHMKSLVDAMAAVSNDVAIEISEKGFRAQAKDTGTAWAVDVFLEASLFKELAVDSVRVFHVDLKDFADFIKTAKNQDALEIKDNESAGTLDIKLFSTSIEKNMALRLNDVGSHKFLGIMERPFFSTSIMDSDLFADAIKAAELGDEHVTINNSKERLYFEAASTTRTAKATINYEPNDAVQEVRFQEGSFKDRDGSEKPIPQAHEGIFALKFLKHISRLGKGGSVIEISISDKQPLRAVYKIEDDKGYIAFAVAPRAKDYGN